MSRKMRMFLTNTLRCFKIQTSVHCCQFVVHKQNYYVRGLSSHYHMRFDPKLGYGIFAIHHIPYAFDECKTIVDPLLTVGTSRRVLRVNNTDDGQTAAAGQHWTGALKHRLSAHY